MFAGLAGGAPAPSATGDRSPGDRAPQDAAETESPMERQTRYWNTRFGRWVSSIGVETLTARLARRGYPLTRKAIYHWISGRRQPRFDHAVALIQLSQGKLTMQDVQRPSHSHRTIDPAITF